MEENGRHIPVKISGKVRLVVGSSVWARGSVKSRPNLEEHFGTEPVAVRPEKKKSVLQLAFEQCWKIES